MENLLIVGTPLALGTFVAGIAELLKRAPQIPYITKDSSALLIRIVVAVLAVATQAIFASMNGQPLDSSVLADSAITYFTASSMYIHLFKNL